MCDNGKTREEKLKEIIKELIGNIRAKNEKYGSEYCGGITVQKALSELKDMDICICGGEKKE